MGERGTQSAREVADVVLLDDDFGTLVKAVTEGRQLLENLRACFRYLLVVHLPLVFTAAFVPLAGHPLLYLPLHIVWLELIIHPTALLAFQAEARGPLGEQRTAPSGFFSLRDWLVLLSSGALGTAAVAMGFLFGLRGAEAAHGRTVALLSLVTLSAVASALLSRLRTRAARLIPPVTLGASLLLSQLPQTAGPLQLQPLHPEDLTLALAAGALACLPLAVDAGLRRGRAPSPETSPGPRSRRRAVTAARWRRSTADTARVPR